MTLQHKINSGFGARSAAEEVLQGLDLEGTTAMVTGGYSGLGLKTTKALAAAGARMVVPARRPDHAQEVLGSAGLYPDRVAVDALDLADQHSVKDFSARFLDSGRSLDILINNAAIMASAEKRVVSGWESQGGIMTELQRHLPREEMIAAGWLDAQGKVDPRFKSPEQGAATSIWAGVDAHAVDPDAAARLWDLSAELTGINVFA
ncbi:MAG: SDR family NAD(P)-dependent oxidoreductase [Actinomycetota bacterium]|nr:SDR family NAD(P)-dependent oxidoreductase [Actinomycetota bacterium]